MSANLAGDFNTPESSTVTDSYVFDGSGRFYLDRNRWRGFNYSYGPSYYQHAQDFGTATNPAVNLNTYNGHVAPVTGTVKSITFVSRLNSTEAVTYQWQLILISNGTSQTNIASWTDSSSSAVENIQTITINAPINQGDSLIIAGTKLGGNGSRRYAYSHWSILME